MIGVFVIVHECSFLTHRVIQMDLNVVAERLWRPALCEGENYCLAQSSGFVMTALCSGVLCLYQTGLLPRYLWLIQVLSTKNVKRKTIFVFCEFFQLRKNSNHCPNAVSFLQACGHQVGQLTR